MSSSGFLLRFTEWRPLKLWLRVGGNSSLLFGFACSAPPDPSGYLLSVLAAQEDFLPQFTQSQGGDSE
jgi:hypothetical protein